MPRHVDLEGRVHHGSVRVLLPGVEHEVHAVADLGQGVDTALVPGHTLSIMLGTVHRDLHPPSLVPAPRPVDDQRPVVSVDLGPDRGVVTVKYYQNILKHGT